MILVTGGSGFIGRRVVSRLADGGSNLRVLARGQRHADLPEGVEVARGDVVSGEGLPEAMAGVEKVVHLVAIIRESGGQTFEANIWHGTEKVVEAAKAAEVKKLVYVSAIGAQDNPTYRYLHAKWQAERAVKLSGLPYTILRPSIVFGEGDEFINALAGLVRYNPVVPVAGDGKARFQPIWVEDLVTCIVACLDEDAHAGQTLEIGGPEQLTYDELLDVVKEALGRSRIKVHVPLAVMRPLAQVMEWVLPKPPVTGEQLKMLALDNIAETDSVMRQFGVQPRRLADSLDYIKR
ncbi:MAG: complex I NDUFA9 subunit family protein [Chloroflexi bacterium]|nr:complex I NDUFA9 subunit family protein [Chloroflexota bacterium]